MTIEKLQEGLYKIHPNKRLERNEQRVKENEVNISKLCSRSERKLK